MKLKVVQTTLPWLNTLFLSLALSSFLVGCSVSKPQSDRAVTEQEQILAASYWTEARIMEAIQPVRQSEEHDHDNDVSKMLGTWPLDTKKFPGNTVGLLLSTFPGNVNSACTAQVVSPTSKNVLMTAAHCVYDPVKKVWASDVNFYLGYGYPGMRILPIKCKTIFTDWPGTRPGTHQIYARDVAFLQLDTKYAGKVLGFRNLPARGELVNAVGYSGAHGGGKTPSELIGKITQASPLQKIATMHNVFTEGASGGAWIQGDRVVGLNSSGVKSGPHKGKVMYGPLMRSEILQLLKHSETTDCNGHNIGSGV